jgi:hypothetical protein
MSLGRNDPCHCGSNKKYKQCHLGADEAAAREARAGSGGEAEGGEAASERQAVPRPARPQTHQPWKRSSANTRGFGNKVSTPRKVGGG